jgi:hypothetical protein
MKKLVSLAVGMGMAVLTASTAQAISEAEINNDIAEFQGFFLKRFPGVTLEDYADGVNVLPQYAHRRANWELMMEFAPYEPEMEKAGETVTWRRQTLTRCTMGPAMICAPWWPT